MIWSFKGIAFLYSCLLIRIKVSKDKVIYLFSLSENNYQSSKFESGSIIEVQLQQSGNSFNDTAVNQI